MKHIIFTLTALFFVIQVSFSQASNTYEVFAIEYGGSPARVPASQVTIGGNLEDSVSFSYYIWFLKGDNGRNILVDVGYERDYSRPLATGQYFIRPDSALQRININPDDITDIIITHAHNDHIGGLHLFDIGNIWMQRNEYTYFVGDAWQEGADHRGLNKDDVPKIVRANLDGRVRFIDGDSIEIIPGVRVFTGSTHTFESQHLLVDTKTEKVMLASDDSWFYYNLDHELSVTLVSDPEAYIHQLQRMKSLVSNPDLIIPGHDPLVMSRFPEVAEGIVRIR
jgi:glyoxylase-like metal-dependent hydrolase (beta-lactamase superfamily II)